MKERSMAVTLTSCPQCQTVCGVTSYGTAFRLQTVKRKRVIGGMFLTGMITGAGLFIFAVALTALGLWSREKIAGPDQGPPAPAAQDLTRVPEVAVDDALPAKVHPGDSKKMIKNLIAKIRETNTPENKDAFVLANMKRRPELRGMPFIMGADCRLEQNRAQSFQASVEAVREGMEADSRVSRHGHQNEDTAFWSTYLALTGNQGLDTDHGIAALTQILGPERKALRADLVQRLKISNRPGAAKLIARAAIFDVDGDNRMAAIKALKDEHKERDAEVTEVLMYGIRYPMPVVAKRAAQAMVMLDRKDMLPQLADVLAEPTPGDPEPRVDANDEVTHVVREVVRINHHRNCLLCHPPASQSGPTQEVPGVIPIPGSPFPTSPKEAYGRVQSSGEPMVRADTTYLRQDFSVMMPVANAAPWPEMQRFDFVVRTRPVEGKELAALEAKVQARPAGFHSENQKAALRVLTDLSGQQNVAPTREAWQRVLGVARAD
jgi:hypothetical protein